MTVLDKDLFAHCLHPWLSRKIESDSYRGIVSYPIICHLAADSRKKTKMTVLDKDLFAHYTLIHIDCRKKWRLIAIWYLTLSLIIRQRIAERKQKWPYWTKICSHTAVEPFAVTNWILCRIFCSSHNFISAAFCVRTNNKYQHQHQHQHYEVHQYRHYCSSCNLSLVWRSCCSRIQDTRYWPRWRSGGTPTPPRLEPGK